MRQQHYNQAMANATSLKLQKRHPIGSDVRWDGKAHTFPEIKGRIEAHLLMNQCGYLFQRRFIRKYREKGTAAAIAALGPSDKVSEEQFRVDRSYLFGILKSVCRHGNALRFIEKHSKRSDGVRCWRDLCEEFGMGGDRMVLISKHENTVSRQFNDDYPGGLVQYLEDIQHAYAEMEMLKAPVPDWKKFQTLMSKILIKDKTEWAISHCQSQYYGKEKSFDQACKYLRGMYLRIDDSVRNESKRHARYASAEAQQQALAIAAMLTQQGSNLEVPKALWDAFREQTKQMVIEDRRTARQKEKSKEGGVHRQYSNPAERNVHKTTTDGACDEEKSDATGESEDPSLDGEGPIDSFVNLSFVLDLADKIQERWNLNERQASMARVAHIDLNGDHDDFTATSCLETRAHLEYEKVLAHFVDKVDTGLATVDSGADTCVIGSNWTIHSIHEHRRANLYGFDSNFAKKKGLPIGSADAVVEAQTLNGRATLVIVRVHEAVLNQSCPTTLLSENQVRSVGHIVDTVHQRFLRDIEGNYGSQRIILQNTRDKEDQLLYIPLVQRGGLMTFKHRPARKEDYEHLVIVELTSDSQWDPRLLNDDNVPTIPRHVLTATGENHDEATLDFYDAMNGDNHHLYIGDTYAARANPIERVCESKTNIVDLLDPDIDAFSTDTLSGHAFYLTIDYEKMEI